MTTLDRLQIQGIRSYGASEPAQNIDFKPPLTLILGPNGSGKTTIIECLRMVCTGVWPPNGTGAPFLNDPKVAIHHTAQTKGQIKMRFRTQQGVLVTVGKLFQLTNKKGDKQEGKKIKQTFEIGAGSSSTTNRCTDMPDMDTRVPELMGVSPAVLKSVIFCHQEEANWVLGEPKILKDNFDAIFASSRYSQALEAIKKLQKEQHDVIKRLEGEVNELSIHKKQAQELRKDKTDAQEETDQLNDQIKELNLQVKETEKQRNICSTALANLEENAQRKAELDTELRVLVSQYDQMDEALKECKEDVEALKGRIKQCKTELGSSNKEKQALSKNIKLRERDAEKCQKAVTKLKDAEATYRAEQMVQKKREDGQQVLATELSNRYQMGTGIGTTSIGSSYSAVCTRMNEICSHKEAELQRLKEEHELKERLVSETLGEKQRQMDRTEHELKEKKKRAGEKRDQVESLRSEIQKTKPPLGALEEAAAEEEVCSNLLNILAGEDAEHVRKIAQLEAKEKDLEEERGEKKELKRKADGDFNQAEMLNKMKREYERHKEKVKGAINKEESRLVAELGQIPPLAELSSSLSSVVADRSRTVGLETSKSAQVKAQLNQLREMALDKTSQIRDLAVKIRTLTEEASKVTCEGTPIEAWEEARSAALPIKEVLLRLEMQKTEKQSRMQLLTMYTLFKRDAARDQHCPLCKRGYDHHDELDEFLRSLDESMENAPAEEQKARKQAERLNQEAEVLRSIQGKLSETEGLEERKRDAEKQLEDITQQLGDKEQEEFQIDEGLNRGQSALREAEELQALVRELDVAGMLRLEQEIEEEEAQSEGKGTGLDRAKIEEEIDELEAHIVQVREQLKQSRNAKDENKRLEEDRRRNLTQAQQKTQKIKFQEETSEGLKRAQSKAEEAILTLELEVRELAQKAPDLESEVHAAEKEKRRLQEQHRAEREKLDKEVSVTRKDAEKLSELEGELMAYRCSNNEENLRKNLEACKAKQEELQRIHSETKDLNAALEDKERGEANGLEKIRSLEAQIKATECAQRIASLKKQLADLEEDELADYPDKEALEEKQQKLQKDVDRLQSTKNQQIGRMQTLKETIKDLKKKLARPDYKNIDEKYKMKSIELQTTKCARKDLEKYYDALDKALMRYHEIKMEEINKCIKEIWEVTYQGKDIDTIQIKADVENTGNKRSHNYRLVMRHQHPAGALAELDMRGRCSAGQKVLASLVVRLALADAFCHNCGILALDEPTSNLDERNIKGFTEALSRIVNDRKQQNASFQLVVISHDKDFINDLARDTEVPVYYRVEKNPNSQSSVITKHWCTGEF